jgi:hypothetical protein
MDNLVLGQCPYCYAINRHEANCSRPPVKLKPEHAKLRKVMDRSQAIGVFLDWAEEQGYVLCALGDERGTREHYWPIRQSKERLLADHFEIDLVKLENEKREILEGLQSDYAALQSGAKGAE